MTCPPAVGRGLVRAGVGVAAVVALVAAGGAALGRQRLGATAADTRALVEAEAQARVVALSAGLGAAAREVSDRGAVVEQALGGAAEPLRALFGDVATAATRPGRLVDALTVYGPEGVPLAWSGRPTSVPPSRVASGAAFFIVSTSRGQRLARIEPVQLPSGGRRVGTAVVEVSLAESPAGLMSAATPAVMQTTVAPVVVLSGVAQPSAEPAIEGTFSIAAVDGIALGRAQVAAEDIAAVRTHWDRRVAAIAWLAAAAGWLLALGLLADWRAVVRRMMPYAGLSFLLAGVGAAAAWCASRAAEALPEEVAPSARFFVRAVLVLGLGWLVATTLNRWRLASGRRRVRVPPARQSVAVAAAAVPAGILLARYGAIATAMLPAGAVETARLALLPVDVAQTVVAAGLLVAHAAAYLGLITWLSLASIAVGGRDGRRTPARLVTAGLGLLGGIVWGGRGGAPVGPAVVAASGLLAMWWWAFRGRRLLAHGSQPARLLVLFAAMLLPSLALYPSLAALAESRRVAIVEGTVAGQVANQRRDLQRFLQQALGELDRTPGLAELVSAAAVVPGAPPGVDAAFHAWSQTVLSTRRLTSSVELYDDRGRLVSRFALNLPETSADQAWRETTCGWELFEEVSPFFAEERRLLHAGRGVCAPGRDGRSRLLGSLVVHVVLDYGNLPFLVARNPYVDLLAPSTPDADAVPASLRDQMAFVVYGWSRRPLFVSGGEAWPLSEALFSRIAASRAAFWTVIEERGVRANVYLLNDRGAIYAVGYPETPLLGHLAALSETVALSGMVFALLLIAVIGGAVLGGRAPFSGRALLRDVRASFSRTLFLAFVAAVVVPVVALALVARAYMATILRADIEQEATRTAISASRVVEDLGTVEARGGSNLPVLDDSLLVWLSRVVGEDLNVFQGPGLLASSERNLFASGLLPTRTPGDIYRALTLDGRPTAVTREAVGTYEYLVASAPVRLDDRQAIVSVPLTLRQRGIDRQLDELDRRVLLAAIAFILLGSAIGYWAAESISDPVSRLTRATRRLAAGDLDARLLVRSSDELGRLVAAFNGMAADLQRQRGQLERTNRLEAWAEMARQVAHDIKNPLTPIQLNAEHLQRVHVDRGRPLGPLVDECVANILLQVRLLRQIAAEFSSFASSPTARPEATDLAPLFEEILSPYERALAGRIVIRREVRAGTPPAMVDRGLLARALTNVIENALHAMPGAGTLQVSAWPEEAVVAVAVSDTGVGMDEAALARIFEPYFSTKATGTGLGLTIARRNVELHGGRIDVASTRGVGTTVTLRVPAAPQTGGPSADATMSGSGTADGSETGSARLDRPNSQSTNGDTR